jgi:lysophospholipase L1-like esterase
LARTLGFAGRVAALSALLAGCSSGGGKAGSGAVVVDAGVDAADAPGTGSSSDGAASDGAGDAPSCPPSTSDAGTTVVTADNGNLEYSGRIDLTDPTHPKFAASSVEVTANFQGSALSVQFQDEYRYGSVNFFEVLVDDLAPFVITPAPGVTSYPVTPAGLCDGVHKVTFVKRTEADIGMATFIGFTFQGSILPPDPKLPRRIEIIGDSITCGAGVEATSTAAPECSQNGVVSYMGAGVYTVGAGYGQGVENGYLAYGSVLARELGAEWHVTCTSGIGLVRNYYNRDNRTMPVLYDLMYPENTATTPTWDTTLYTPDVIVIGLGTNDFSTDSGDPANPRAAQPVDAFEQGYVQFIDQLAAYYPGVTVVLVSSPILGDPQLTQLQTAVADVAAYYGADGGATTAEGGAPNVRVYSVIVDKVVGTGCGGHPSIAQQAAAADQIAPVIRSAMNW